MEGEGVGVDGMRDDAVSVRDDVAGVRDDAFDSLK